MKKLLISRYLFTSVMVLCLFNVNGSSWDGWGIRRNNLTRPQKTFVNSVNQLLNHGLNRLQVLIKSKEYGPGDPRRNLPSFPKKYNGFGIQEPVHLNSQFPLKNDGESIVPRSRYYSDNQQPVRQSYDYLGDQETLQSHNHPDNQQTDLPNCSHNQPIVSQSNSPDSLPQISQEKESHSESKHFQTNQQTLASQSHFLEDKQPKTLQSQSYPIKKIPTVSKIPKNNERRQIIFPKFHNNRIQSRFRQYVY